MKAAFRPEILRNSYAIHRSCGLINVRFIEEIWRLGKPVFGRESPAEQPAKVGGGKSIERKGLVQWSLRPDISVSRSLRHRAYWSAFIASASSWPFSQKSNQSTSISWCASTSNGL